MYLYIDTSFKQTTAILNQDFSLVSFKNFNLEKASKDFHLELYHHLKNHDTKLGSMKGLFYCAGPGSYTGMRLAHTFAKVCESQQMPIFSFYRYEVPMLAGIQEGIYYANAFKNELFTFSWQGHQGKKELVKKEDFDVEALRLRAQVFDEQKCNDIIQRESKSLFTKIFQEQMKKELYYYRPLEVEFKKDEKLS